MNHRNINAAAKPQTIFTVRKRLEAACQRCRDSFRSDAFERHLKHFANRNVCYVAANGISLPVCLG